MLLLRLRHRSAIAGAEGAPLPGTNVAQSIHSLRLRFVPGLVFGCKVLILLRLGAVVPAKYSFQIGKAPGVVRGFCFFWSTSIVAG
jgi:hypothetical protein